MKKKLRMTRRHFSEILVAGASGTLLNQIACQTRNFSGPLQDDSNKKDAETFDFVIVGSGAGGGPLAANLVKAGFSVLLLEAGERDDEPGSQAELTRTIPALHAVASEQKNLAWEYFVEHYATERTESKQDPKHTDNMDIADGADPLIRDPQKRGILYPRGGTLGGSTAIHAMITLYPEESDWIHLMTYLKDETWSPAEMRRHFDAIEDARYVPLSLDRRKNPIVPAKRDAWLSLEFAPLSIGLKDSQLRSLVLSAAKVAINELGIGKGISGVMQSFESGAFFDPNNRTVEKHRTESLFRVPTSTKNGKRNGVRERLLEAERESHGKLVIRTGALVTKVIIEERQDRPGLKFATGVQYKKGKNLYKADKEYGTSKLKFEEIATQVALARYEVILAAGAFNTPQLLMLSGIGPEEHLKEHGIPVVVHNPVVGTNLQDRYEIGTTVALEKPFAFLSECSFGEAADPCVKKFFAGDLGAYGTNGVVLAFKIRSVSERNDPDILIFGVPNRFNGYFPGYSSQLQKNTNTFTWVVLKGHTENQAGVVRLRSNNPTDTPQVLFNYFSGKTTQTQSEADLQAMLAAVKFCRRLSGQPQIGHSAPIEIYPGQEKIKSDAELMNWIKTESWGHHASCTCPMGPDLQPGQEIGSNGAVLDSKFRVNGVKNLRVVDASIFPKIPGLFIVCPIYIASQKASEIIIADAKNRQGAM